MNRVFRKYKFGSKGAFTTKLKSLGVDEDGNPSHPHLITELGYELLSPAEYDENGEVITEAVYSSNYLVDVLWNGKAESSWDNQMIWCKPLGIHTFANSAAVREWMETCKSIHPEYFPEPSEEI